MANTGASIALALLGLECALRHESASLSAATRSSDTDRGAFVWPYLQNYPRLEVSSEHRCAREPLDAGFCVVHRGLATLVSPFYQRTHARAAAVPDAIHHEALRLARAVLAICGALPPLAKPPLLGLGESSVVTRGFEATPYRFPAADLVAAARAYR
eukprot:7386614-Prymnesium_polylepis.1